MLRCYYSYITTDGASERNCLLSRLSDLFHCALFLKRLSRIPSSSDTLRRTELNQKIYRDEEQRCEEDQRCEIAFMQGGAWTIHLRKRQVGGDKLWAFKVRNSAKTLTGNDHSFSLPI